MPIKIAYPFTGHGIGGSIVSTALLARQVQKHPSFECKVAIPEGAKAIKLFDDLGVGMVPYRLSPETTGSVKRTRDWIAKLTSIYSHCKISRKARVWLRKERPSVVHINGSGTMFSWGIAAKLEGLPVIWHVRRQSRNRILDPIRLVLADHLILVAEAIRERFDPWVYRPPISVIYNSVDTDLFRPPENKTEAKQRIGVEDNSTVIGFVGNLVPRKRPEWLAEAGVKLLQEGYNVEFVFVGSDYSGGDYLRQLQLTAEKSGRPDRYHFLGYRSDVHEVMKALDILVLPSREKGEAFPRVLLEGMATGNAVVATSVAGVPEMIKDGNTGVLVDPNSFTDFLSSCKALVDNRSISREFGEAARLHIKREFSLGSRAEEVVKVYRHIISK